MLVYKTLKIWNSLQPLYIFSADIANSMDSDRSSLIRGHSVCYHVQKYSHVHLNICSRRKKAEIFKTKCFGAGKRLIAVHDTLNYFQDYSLSL